MVGDKKPSHHHHKHHAHKHKAADAEHAQKLQQQQDDDKKHNTLLVEDDDRRRAANQPVAADSSPKKEDDSIFGKLGGLFSGHTGGIIGGVLGLIGGMMSGMGPLVAILLAVVGFMIGGMMDKHDPAGDTHKGPQSGLAAGKRGKGNGPENYLGITKDGRVVGHDEQPDMVVHGHYAEVRDPKTHAVNRVFKADALAFPDAQGRFAAQPDGEPVYAKTGYTLTLPMKGKGNGEIDTSSNNFHELMSQVPQVPNRELAEEGGRPQDGLQGNQYQNNPGNGRIADPRLVAVAEAHGLNANNPQYPTGTELEPRGNAIQGVPGSRGGLGPT